MKILNRIFLFTIFPALFEFSNPKNLKESTNKPTRSIDGNLNETEPFIRNTVKPKDKSKKKHVTFSDQVLDDTIGADPLDAKSDDRKCTQRKLKKTSTGIKNNSFNKYSISLFWLFTAYFLSLMFVIC